MFLHCSTGIDVETDDRDCPSPSLQKGVGESLRLTRIHQDCCGCQMLIDRVRRHMADPTHIWGSARYTLKSFDCGHAATTDHDESPVGELAREFHQKLRALLGVESADGENGLCRAACAGRQGSVRDVDSIANHEGVKPQTFEVSLLRLVLSKHSIRKVEPGQIKEAPVAANGDDISINPNPSV